MVNSDYYLQIKKNGCHIGNIYTNKYYLGDCDYNEIFIMVNYNSYTLWI